MSNEELEKYKLEYQTLVEKLVLLHNKNLYFLERAEQLHTGIAMRTLLRDIQFLAIALKRRTKLVYAEAVQNSKNKKQAIKEAKKSKKRRRILKNVNNRRTTKPL